MINHKSLILENKVNVNIKNDLAIAEKIFEYSNSIFYLEPQKYFSASDFIYNSLKKYRDKIFDNDYLLYEILVNFGNDYKIDFIKKTINKFFKIDLTNALKDNKSITFLMVLLQMF